MHTFPATTRGLNFREVAAKAGQGAIIPSRPTGNIRRWLGFALRGATAIVLLAALGGCSAIRLAYGQAPNLAYWWVDDFVDLTDTQSTVLRKDIENFFAWHRAKELPLYVERLEQWQTLAAQDTTAEQSCQQFDLLRAAYQRSVERSIEPFARLALGLQPDQLQHLARHHAKSDQKFSDEWLDDGEEARRSRLFDKALDRYETLYGDLSTAQRNALQARTKTSGFDPVRVQAERKRRQADLLSTLKQAQTQPTQATALLRQWHNRVLNSPDPSYAAYSRAVIREGCEQYAALHNTTSAQQRAHAANTLRQYESDLIALQRTD
jgi:hypothetical protein